MKTTTKESATDYLMDHLKVCETKEDLILAFWFYWVESVTISSFEFRKVVTSSAVSKWFTIELHKEELEFKDLIKRYPRVNGRDKDRLYCKCISKLMSRFPIPLLNEAKKRDQQPSKVPGIRVPFPIEILN
ncbi:hypothetical protein CFS9_13490 [Flavobacterium sp. CFS9]|uniref:Uncharacterized protein n=1 Tax=Flavobacterium sp. CFS9 TaxID=3143118 RepID=A0AAT9GZR3_9FLAO